MKSKAAKAPQMSQPEMDGAASLAELALNLHWTWNHATDELWQRLDSELWQATQNPWVVLQTISKDALGGALAQPGFRQRLNTVLQRNRDNYAAEAWFQDGQRSGKLTSVAYFSMEFMLSEALPIYSGGLGQVAGDQMKAASDLGVPVTGIGLLYGQGYFRQDFDAAGRQQVLYPVNDPGQLPIKPLRRANGEWLRIPIQLPGSKIWLRCWEVSVGRNKLYLLDTNDFANTAAQRGICSQLYGGDAEMRLRQELVLGIGGWRLLRSLGVAPEVCHLNEGHAAFAVLERARCYMEDHSVPFALALAVTRAGNIFTTHTAVPAGFDRFAPDLIRKYLTHYAVDELKISTDDLFALGRQSPGDSSEPLNMAYLAMRGSGEVNGVSKLHGQVSRQIFQPLFPRWPEDEVPVGSVTNGVHVPTWDSQAADALWTAACGKDRWRGGEPDSNKIRQLTDAELWQMRTQARKTSIQQIRRRYQIQLASEGKDWSTAMTMLNDDTLTVGFARRFATYKRPNLLLHDPARLVRLLTSKERPMQLILAGKAHPQDLPGQALIKQWNDFIRVEGLASQVIFLSDYDMRLAQELVGGVDLWVNTPRRPWEACGTSGMKVLANGGLNLSELDGWWAEAYSPEIGWAIGDGREHGEEPAWDAAEADAMYQLLENEIVPDFYECAQRGDPPAKWLARVRESMTALTPEFSASRAVRDYAEKHYVPAAASYVSRAANDSLVAKEILKWQNDLAQHWSSLRLDPVNVTTQRENHLFKVKLAHADLPPNSYRVELYANPEQDGKADVYTMSVSQDTSKPEEDHIYSVEVPALRSAADYSVRVVPEHAQAFVPLEAAAILWAQ
ncbi:alpha-glucan family phosphorylase [Granulicella arctica]|uniref:alpha-glucan family phosphorylase n=1 Tax=Granulicella arctica TaxID=940613 RepID=UPI0021E0CD3C|nr:alpha-glucan family phosphorylase [Granulicella arctica]